MHEEGSDKKQVEEKEEDDCGCCTVYKYVRLLLPFLIEVEDLSGSNSVLNVGGKWWEKG